MRFSFSVSPNMNKYLKGLSGKPNVFLLLQRVSRIASTCVYQGVRNVRFSENLACFVILTHTFWDSPFCLIIDDFSFKTCFSSSHGFWFSFSWRVMLICQSRKYYVLLCWFDFCFRLNLFYFIVIGTIPKTVHDCDDFPAAYKSL